MRGRRTLAEYTVTRLHQLPEQGADLVGGPSALATLPRPHQPAHPVERGQHQAWRQFLVAGKAAEHAARILTVHRHREYRAEDDVGGDVRHLDLDVVLAAVGEQRHALQQRLGCIEHARERHVHARMRKGRIHHRALAPPLGAVGAKDAVTEQRAQGVSEQRTLRKAIRLLHQHLAHQRGLVDHVEIESRQMHFTHLHPVAALRQTVHPRTARPEEHQHSRQPGADRGRIGGTERTHADNSRTRA